MKPTASLGHCTFCNRYRTYRKMIVVPERNVQFCGEDCATTWQHHRVEAALIIGPTNLARLRWVEPAQDLSELESRSRNYETCSAAWVEDEETIYIVVSDYGGVTWMPVASLVGAQWVPKWSAVPHLTPGVVVVRFPE